MISKTEILSRKKPAPTVRGGVYVLLEEDEIVYIGQSRHMERRVARHADTEKEFDSVAYFSCSNRKDRVDLEEAMIENYRPKYNTIDEITPQTATMFKSQYLKAKALVDSGIDPEEVAERTGIREIQAKKIRSGYSYMRVYDDLSDDSSKTSERRESTERMKELANDN